MPPAERSRARVAAWALVAVLAALALIPAYLLVPADWRPLGVRLACALVVIVVCVRTVGRVRRANEADAPSPLDAPRPAPRRPAQDERFVRVRDDVVFSTRSRGYFETILWPRLRKLGATEPPAEAERRWPARRGPSLRTLKRLIADIERRA
jgi:hypothetical protein